MAASSGVKWAFGARLFGRFQPFGSIRCSTVLCGSEYPTLADLSSRIPQNTL